MVAFDPNWTRWIFASCRKYFNDRVGNFKLFYIPTDDKNGLATYGELRINGPEAKRLSSNEWRLEILINVLISADMNNQDTDLIFKSCGIIQNIMPLDLPILKLGSSNSDDQSQLGCMKALDETIRTSHFGQFDPKVTLLQSTVEANYQIRLP